MTPQNNPTINPAKTSNKVCCFTMIRAVPSIPDSKMKKEPPYRIEIEYKAVG